MRKMSLTAAVIAATLSTAAIAADWVLVTNVSGGAFFIDRDSIRTMSNGYKRAWSRNVYAKPNEWGDTSFKGLMEFDCREWRFRMLQATFIKGDQVTSTISKITEWQYAGPETVGEEQLNFVCFGKLPD